MQIEVRKFEPLPVGIYTVSFKKVEEIVTQHGEALRWEFEVVKGEYTGRLLNCLTAPYATTKNKTGRLILTLVGDMDVDPELAVGNHYYANVQIKGEFNSIEIIKPVSKSQSSAKKEEVPTVPEVDTSLVENDFLQELEVEGLKVE
jgi:hypothetical protein